MTNGCQHCGRRRAFIARDLCRACYHDPAVKPLYPPTYGRGPTRRRWTPEDDDLLRKLVAGGRIHSADIADRLGRTQHAVGFRAHHLGLTLPMMRWTEAEREAMRQWYATTPVSVLAESLGRSSSSIRSRAGQLGVRSQKPPTAGPIATLAYRLGLPDRLYPTRPGVIRPRTSGTPVS